jgi:predicted solute-binding protein
LPSSQLNPVKVCAVSYLNTSPLVWGMLHGPQQGVFDLTFRVPSDCAREVAEGRADIGIVPSVELNDHDYARVHGLGIASRGSVRSILLVSTRPLSQIRTLAADTSSRTSVMLARIILAQKYEVYPRIIPHAPDLDTMLRAADAALLIGDPALRIEPGALPYEVSDLGTEWSALTGLPMVFAVWAGRKEAITPAVERVFADSYQFGRTHLEDILRLDAASRGISPQLAREYLTRHIVCELGPQEYAGLTRFLTYARAAREAASV